MNFPMRRFAKWGLWGLAALAAILGVYLSVFFLPYPMFPHHAELAGFSVYSDREIADDFGPAMQEARRRIQAMELDRGGRDLRIFVCNSQSLFTALNRLAGKRHWGQALVISAAGNAFFSVSGIDTIGRRNGGRFPCSRLDGSWSAAIAHEAAHELMADRLGLRRARKVAVWKAEGYADYQANVLYLASDPGYDLRRRIGWVLDDERWSGPTASVDRRHARWQVLVEYLCGVEGLVFDQLLDENLTENAAWSRMMTWYSADEADADLQGPGRADAS